MEPVQDPRDKKVPAAKVVSDKWFVRVDGEESFLRQKCEEMAKWNTTVLFHAVYHVGKRGENPHVHFIHMENKSIQKQSYDLIIKKRFNVVGGSYSTKPWDGQYEGAGTYLYHEADDSPVMASEGIEELHLVYMKEKGAEWRARITEVKKKASTTLVQRVTQHFTEMTESYARAGKAPPEIHKKKIWNALHAFCREDDVYYPGENLMKKYTTELLCKLGSQGAWESYTDESYDRVFFVRT